MKKMLKHISCHGSQRDTITYALECLTFAGLTMLSADKEGTGTLTHCWWEV